MCRTAPSTTGECAAARSAQWSEASALASLAGRRSPARRGQRQQQAEPCHLWRQPVMPEAHVPLLELHGEGSLLLLVHGGRMHALVKRKASEGLSHVRLDLQQLSWD